MGMGIHSMTPETFSVYLVDGIVAILLLAFSLGILTCIGIPLLTIHIRHEVVTDNLQVKLKVRGHLDTTVELVEEDSDVLVELED